MPWSVTTQSTWRTLRWALWSLPISTHNRPCSGWIRVTRWLIVMRVSVSLNARAYGTWFMPPTSMPNIRSGVTISRRAPERAITSAADSAEWVPLSS